MNLRLEQTLKICANRYVLPQLELKFSLALPLLVLLLDFLTSDNRASSRISSVKGHHLTVFHQHNQYSSETNSASDMQKNHVVKWLADEVDEVTAIKRYQSFAVQLRATVWLQKLLLRWRSRTSR